MPQPRRIYLARAYTATERREIRTYYRDSPYILTQDFQQYQGHTREWSSASHWTLYRAFRLRVAEYLADNGGSLEGLQVGRLTLQRVGTYVYNVANYHDMSICDSCRRFTGTVDEYSRCDDCTVLCADCGCTVESVSEDGYCDDCDSARDRTTHRLNLSSYSSKEIARRKFNGTDDPSERYYGVELEMEYNGGNALDPREVLPVLAVLKEDGSLDDDKGAEWVSAPCSEAYWREKAEAFQAGLKRLATNGWSSWETNRCGLHIHVSKPSTYVVAKFLTLVYSNPNIILSLSGRSSHELEQWASLNDTSLDRLIKKATRRDPSTKYAAVNMQPPETIELRFFRGSMLGKRFYMALEFVWSALAYVEREAGMKEAADWRAFSRFVQRNGKTYPNFLEWLRKHGHAPMPKARKAVA